MRELENAIEHAAVLGASEMILAEDLPESLREYLREKPKSDKAGDQGSLQNAVNAAKRVAVQRAYQQAHNDHNEAAKLLGVHPNYLYRLIRNLDMQPLTRESPISQ
jgi:two-component system, NtrC family, response regulator HydG